MIVMPPEERARRIQEDKKIMAAFSEKVASMRKTQNTSYKEKLCEWTPIELIDAVYEMVFAYKPDSPAQEEWKREWLLNAKRHGAGLDC